MLDVQEDGVNKAVVKKEQEDEDTLVPTKEKVGLLPGSLIYTGKETTVKSELLLFIIKELEIRKIPFISIEKLLAHLKTLSPDEKAWIIVIGMNETRIYELLQETFQIEPLFMEDILNVSQRPKIELDDNMLFFVAKYLETDLTKPVKSYQIGIVLTKQVVLTFFEKKLPWHERMIQRVIEHMKRLNDSTLDHVVSGILDQIVDNYFVTVNELEDRIEELEGEVIENPTFDTLQRIQQLKKRVMVFRRVILATRDLFAKVNRLNIEVIPEDHKIYFSDINDHVLEILDSIDSLRDILFGLTDLYMSSVSNKANDTMKVLTIIATIFIPHTFIVGWYGMNFEYMPELRWPYAYPLLFVILSLITIVMIAFFRKKKWL